MVVVYCYVNVEVIRAEMFANAIDQAMNELAKARPQDAPAPE